MHSPVLVVEDDQAVSDLIQTVLQQLGEQSAVCDTAEKGIELIQQGRPEMVITDMGLAGKLDGRHVAKKAAECGCKMIIIISGNLSKSGELAEELYRLAGATPLYILRKPFRIMELQELIRQMKEKRS